ncbi:SRPBCC family protein [Candidatus Saccharibacteria bacterium]|nr:SRPBCC family protein [Candidatus Saccharibacteria bacterium]
MKTTTLSYSIRIQRNQKVVFDYISDWEQQSNWVLFTTVQVLLKTKQSQDSILLAVTKIGPFKLMDSMVITDWLPYDRIVIEHTGRLVMGKGIFEVKKISDNESEFIWQEVTPVPFGLIGRATLFVAKPILRLMFDASQKKLKAAIEARP